MLKRAESGDLPRLLSFFEGNLIGTYLSCRARCYGADYDFVRFWYAEDETGVHSVIGALDSAALVLADDRADGEELRCFCEMQGFSSVMTDAAMAARCGCSVRARKTAFRFSGAAPDEMTAQEDADMRAVYRLIASAIPNSFDDTKEAYLRFLSDFTFRKNRNAAHLSVIQEDGQVLATALTAAETPTAAVLSGVAVASAARKTGLGRRVVLSLVKTLIAQNKMIDVIALNASAEAFYQRIGFEKTGEICLI